MTSALQSPIGLVAGSGIFPLEFARNARARGLDVVAFAHVGETDPSLESLVGTCEWIHVGQLGKILDGFKRLGVRQVAFAGGITRSKLFSGVRLDMKAVALIARMRSVKDDVILRGVAGELESSGIEVISAGLLLERSVASCGLLSRREFSAQELHDAVIGWDAATKVGALDIGQTVVVTQGVVTAVEAVEGTDAAILRAGQLGGPGGVVVKVAKPQQDLRIDLPTIGPTTIESMKTARASALALEAGKTIILEPLAVAAAADRAGIAVHVFASYDELLALNSQKSA